MIDAKFLYCAKTNKIINFKKWRKNMSYIKNYNVGQIQLDLPTPNYFHELPLLSFGDIHGSVNLSLVFNYGMNKESSNPYSIAAGYKLNMQKRIVMSNEVPCKFQNETGKTITLNKTNNLYSFDDDTQRVLRLNNDGSYELENADFSKEIYDNAGKITKVYDKYEVPVLSYSYNPAGQLISIAYRTTKTITLSYNSASCLSSITYNGKTISLTYATSEVQVSHYNGVTFKLTFSNENFTATATATENSTVVTYATKIERPSEYWKILKISNLIGTDIVDEMTYEFSDMIIDYPDTVLQYTHKHSQVDMTDKNGVKTRVQYQNEKPLYSYEVTTDGEYVEGDINIFNTIDDLENTNISGKFNKSTGIAMYVTNSNTQVWEHNACDYYDSSVMGYYIITGWIRSKDNYVSSPLCISKGGGTYDIQFTPDVTPYKQWKYFAYKFYLNANFIKVFPENTGFVELKDLRIIFKPTHIIDNENGKRRIAISENVLVYHSGNTYDYLPIDEATFTCGSEYLSDYGKVHFEDILRYKLNKKKNVHTNEIYYDKCKNILYTSSSNELKVMYNGTAYSLNSFYLGKRRYTSNGIVTTVFKDDTTNFLVCESIDANGAVVSSQTFNNKLDVVSASTDGVTTVYTRQNDLLVYESVSCLYTRTTAYGVDASGCPTITTVDEFNNTTVYTLDSVWGNVKSVILPDGKIITDEYDEDACAKLKRTFTAGGRSNVYEYFGGNLSRVQSNGIFYDFTYSKGDLSAIKKNNVLIEEHEITDTQTDSYYPSKAAAVYSNKATFDKYGRLTSIDGVITNTYKNNPICVSGDYSASENDNASAKLATSEDLITGNVTKFAYDGDKPDKIGVFNSFGTKINEEIVSYDDIDRVISDEYFISVSDSKSIKETKTYVTPTTSPNADNRVAKYSFYHNGVMMVSSVNTYDELKRLSDKVITVGENEIVRSFNYDYTCLGEILEYRNGSAIHDYVWNSDSSLRTTIEHDYITDRYTNKYEYDSYGQLIREDNGHYGKTILYTYDNIGNITKAQKYDYTTGAVSGTPTEDTYVYSTSYPDRLTSFNNKSITYDNNGYVKTYSGWTYTWHKGKLNTISMNTSSTSGGTSQNYTFTYNAQGQRTKKKYTYSPGLIQQIDYMTSCTTAYEYDLHGRLLSDTRTLNYNDGTTISKKFVFLYEESEIVGVIFTNSSGTGTYYYDKNPRGDVIGILDNSGNTVVKYTYDAYGNCTRGYTTNTDLADSNPIRYRSYYYDKDTGLYYLNARYYNPEWRRFISPDDTAYLDIESANGLNLYAYCGNDPINRYDPSGCAWDTVLDIISIGWSLYDLIKKPSWENAGWLALDVVFAVVPFLTGSRIMKAASKLDDISDIGGYMNKFDNVYDSIVIGNDMGRVTNLAFDTGSMIYDGYKPLNALYAMGKADEVTNAMRYAAKVDNARFIMDKFNAGYRIINAGSDGRGFIKMMKSAYGMELRILYRLKYGNKLHKLWWIFNSGRRIIW